MSKWAQDFAQPKWKVTQVTCYTLKPLMLETHCKQLNLYISLQSFLGPFKMTKLSWKVTKIKMIVAKFLNASQIFINLPSLIIMPYVSQISFSVSHMFHMFHSPQFTPRSRWISLKVLKAARHCSARNIASGRAMTLKWRTGQAKTAVVCIAAKLEMSRDVSRCWFFAEIWRNDVSAAATCFSTAHFPFWREMGNGLSRRPGWRWCRSSDRSPALQSRCL